MSRSRKTAPAARSATIPPSGTTRLFAPRKPRITATLTSERLAADLAAFRKAGGRIEVLGTTRSLKKIDPKDAASAPRPASAVATRSR